MFVSIFFYPNLKFFYWGLFVTLTTAQLEKRGNEGQVASIPY
jgi:hypothetical protein